jgi:hypothetical protein
VIGVPQLCGDENFFARNVFSSESCLQRAAYFALVPVALGAIEVSKSGLQRISGRSYGHGWVRNQRAEAERGDLAGSVAEWNSRHPQINRPNHG